jgi:hypothetical protein
MIGYKYGGNIGLSLCPTPTLWGIFLIWIKEKRFVTKRFQTKQNKQTVK